MAKLWDTYTEEERQKEIDYYVQERKLCCTVCKSEIPPERIRRKATTCSHECGKIGDTIRRNAKVAGRRCRLCNRPATPEEMEQFKQWRKSLPKPPRKNAVLEAPPAPSAADLDAVAAEQSAAEQTSGARNG
jgi:hypothetical protein